MAYGPLVLDRCSFLGVPHVYLTLILDDFFIGEFQSETIHFSVVI